MASLPTPVSYYREVGAADDAWTAAAGGEFQGDALQGYEIICVGASEARNIIVPFNDPGSFVNLAAWVDADADRMFQDSPGTTAVEAAGNPVALIDGINTLPDAVQTTDANRPIYRIDQNGNGYIAFDGTTSTSLTLPDLGSDATVIYNNGRDVVTLTGQTISGAYGIPPRRNLLPRSDCYLGDDSWEQTGSIATNLSLNVLGVFDGVSVASNGGAWHRFSILGGDLVSGTDYSITVWYKGGTASTPKISVRNNTTGTDSGASGSPGDFSIVATNAGSLSIVSQTLIGDVHKIVLSFTPNADGVLKLGIGPNSTTVGETVIALGAQFELGEPSPYQETKNDTVAEPVYRLIVHDGTLNTAQLAAAQAYMAGFTHNALPAPTTTPPSCDDGAAVSFFSTFDEGLVLTQGSTEQILNIDFAPEAFLDCSGAETAPTLATPYIAFEAGDISQRFAEIRQDPIYSDNHALVFGIREPNVGGTKGRVQLVSYDNANIKQATISTRMMLGGGMEALREYPDAINWLTISEWWNNPGWISDPYPFRISVHIVKESADPSSPLLFRAEAQTQGEDGRWTNEIWSHTATGFHIDTRRWINLQYGFKEGGSSTGRFFMSAAYDGDAAPTTIFDITDATHHPDDPAPDGLTHVNPLKLYTSADLINFVKGQGEVIEIYWDDLKIAACSDDQIAGGACDFA
jgi:hypothetical protein